MGLIRALRRFAAQTNQDGVALFMVIGAMTILAILVSEFTYVAQVNQKLAYDTFDQVKALYGAKSGLKLSLMRLKAYQNLKSLSGAKIGGIGQGVSAPEIPKKLLQQLWAFPIVFPLPAVPGLSTTDQERLQKFNANSGLEGVQFSAIIETESAKYPINQMAGVQTLPSPSPSASPIPGTSSTPSVDPKQAFGEFLNDLINERKKSDEGFAAEYRDLRLEELVQHINAWVDPTAEDPAYGREGFPGAKKAPFYSLSELHMVPSLDDTLYDLFQPHLTVLSPQGLNVNMMSQTMLRALVPQMRDEEAKEYFEFKDAADVDNSFKDEAAFFGLLQKTVSAFRNTAAFEAWKDQMKKRGIAFVTDDTEFKITVRSQVNRTVRTIEAWVTVQGGTSTTPPAVPGKPATPTKDAGIKIVSMRIL